MRNSSPADVSHPKGWGGEKLQPPRVPSFTIPAKLRNNVMDAGRYKKSTPAWSNIFREMLPLRVQIDLPFQKGRSCNHLKQGAIWRGGY